MLGWLKKKKESRPELKAEKPKHFRMWNGVDLELYIKSQHPQCLVTVYNFLRLFQWDRSAEVALRYLIDRDRLNVQVQSEKIRSKHKDTIQEPEDLFLAFGVCTRCGGEVKGQFLPACEHKKTGRIYLKICDDCSYYAEGFRIDEKLIEIEGGE